MQGILVVNKPRDWTSHDVVAKLRGIYQQRRIGHSGTLDPMATGVLVVFLGRATRAVELCENDEKEYIAGLRLGEITNTQDITGQVLERRDGTVTREALTAALEGFLGPQQQIPPMYSAVKIGGRKLYELARKGQTVERKPRDIVIHELELLSLEGCEAKIRVKCSKGTYVRTLCHDIGLALGTGGCLSALTRTKAGRFTLADTVTLEEIQVAKEQGTHLKLLRTVDSLFADCPAVSLNDEDARKCRNGTDIMNEFPAEGMVRVYDRDGEFLMLGDYRDGVLRTVKSFFEVR